MEEFEGTNDYPDFDKYFDPWAESEGTEIPKTRKGDKENRPGVEVSGEKASGGKPAKSPQEMREERQKRIVDAQIIKLLAEVRRGEQAKKLAASGGEVTAETYPELFDESGAKLTFDRCKSDPGTTRY